MGEIWWNGAGDDVSGQEFRFLVTFGERDRYVVAFEKRHQIGDSAVIDVFIGRFQSPYFWVFREIRLHIEVDELLEILVERIAESADHHIGAYAAFAGDIAFRVFKRNVGRIIPNRDADLFAGLGSAGFAWVAVMIARKNRKERNIGYHSRFCACQSKLGSKECYPPLTIAPLSTSFTQMKTHFFSFIVSLLTVCVALAQTKEPVIDPALPNVLLIGDSISEGYQKQVKEGLIGKANVYKNQGNAEWSGTGIIKIDSYLGETKWDVIHFNWGLWDIYGWEYDHEDRSPEAYAKRLDQLVTRMEKTGAKLIWATTTPGCKDPEKTMQNRFKKEVVITPEQQAKYSEAALEVMKKHKVEINDLYADILPELDKYSLGKNDVHFNREGSDFLAKKVIAAIEAPLKNLK